MPSGRWQARYRALDGSLATAPATFATRTQAAAFLAQVQADRTRGVCLDPRAGSVPVGEYAVSWLAQRVDLRPRTVELYDGLLRWHLLPHLARVRLYPDHPRGGTPLARRPSCFEVGPVDGCPGISAAAR